MNEKLEETIPICIKCAHYAFWDGDDACVEKMKLLESFPIVCRKFSQNECEKLLQLKINAYLKRKGNEKKEGRKEE